MKSEYELYSAYDSKIESAFRKFVKDKWLHIYGYTGLPFGNDFVEADLVYADSDNPFTHSYRFSYRIKFPLCTYHKMCLQYMLVLGKKRNAKCFI